VIVGSWRRLSLAIALSSIAAIPAIAQHDAQRVVLRIAPPAGDTLRMELEQLFEMESGSPARVMSGSMRVWTRAIVLHRSSGYTDLLSVTDSVRVSPSNVALKPLREAQSALEGRRVRLRVNHNGGMSVGGGIPGMFGGATEMPSVLPGQPVAVGDSWTRDLQVPLSATHSSMAEARTTFRLDSLASYGAVAYISFHGAVSHDHSQDGEGATGKTVGTLEGTMELDRRLSWITDSEMVVSVVSDIQPVGKPAVHARMRVTQSLRALVAN
jgi:uncharacterized protein DUF6263